jgi:hypothetical protein
MRQLRRGIVFAGLIALTGCATDWNCGCHRGLLGRLTGRSREVECCPCPMVDDPCCDNGFFGGPVMGAPEGVEVFSPPAFDAMPAQPLPTQPLPPAAQPMAKPTPYSPNGK